MKPVQRSRWILSAGLIVVAGATASCKNKQHAAGEVSRTWTPPKQEEYMGVRAADAQAAIQRRLADTAPTPVNADEWKHVKKLYATFGQNLSGSTTRACTNRASRRC